MRFACWITKAANTHSEYVIFIECLLQQWLHERASKLRYTYIACLVYSFLRSTHSNKNTHCGQSVQFSRMLKLTVDTVNVSFERVTLFHSHVMFVID